MKCVVLDACVLYSSALRDLFMRLAVAHILQPKWTDQIHDEWMRNVLKNRPDLTREQFKRTKTLMNQWGRDCRVMNIRAIQATLTLPDPNDTHVLAAAIASQTPTIVTFNLSDFPASVLATHGVRAVSPDRFLSELFDDSPEAFLSVVKTHRLALKNPPKSPADYRATLAAHGLPKTAEWLAKYDKDT